MSTVEDGPAPAPAADGGPLLAASGLKKYFAIRGGVTGRTVGFVRAVDGVDLTIQRGKTLGLIGESGCGKTTVGRCLLRLIEPTAGSVRFAGREIAREKRALPHEAAGWLFVAAAVLCALSFAFAFFGFGILLSFAGIGPFLSLRSATGGDMDLAAPLLSFIGVVGAYIGASAAREGGKWELAMASGAFVLLSGIAVPLNFLLGLLTVACLAASKPAFAADSLRSMRKDMQIVFQDPFGSLNPRMLVSKIVTEPLRAFRGEVADRYPGGEGLFGRLSGPQMQAIARDLIARVGLNPEHLNRFPHEFSGGQRQRICVARALSVKPAFVVLDEPTSALDVSVQAQILNLLKELQRERGLTYLFISHHLAVIRHMCDDVAVMYLGKIVERAPNEALFTAPMHPYTMALLSAVPSVDPEARRERIVLEGEIPSPANPPSGCRFHTRCSFALEREVREVEATWAEGKEPTVRVADPLAAPQTVRLVVGGKEIDPLAAARGAVAYEADELPGEGVAVKVKAGIARGSAATVRYRRYRAPCALDEPTLADRAPGHGVACHFSDEALEAQRRAAAEHRPLGAVVAEMRSPIAPSA